MKSGVPLMLLVLAVLLALSAEPLYAENRDRSMVLSLRSGIGIPLPPDTNLFGLGGGAGTGVSYQSQLFQPFSAGGAVTYQLVPMRHDDIGALGSLSVISFELTPAIRHTLRNRISFSGSLLGGYFLALEHSNPDSYATNLVWGGKAGVGFVNAPDWIVGLYGEYRAYESLLGMMHIGIELELILGKKTR